MRMHDLIGKGAAAVRKRNGWTQEEAARAYRSAGLISWRTGTVGSLEAGLRRPRIEEVVLMCAALGTTLADLVCGAAEDGAGEVTVAHGVTLTTGDIESCFRPRGSRGVPAPSRDSLPPERADFTDAELHAARKLGIPAAEVRRASGVLWDRDFDTERDDRVGDITALEPRSRQARRGHIARQMLSELSGHLK